MGEKASIRGYVYVMLSAVIFGFTPVLAAISYEGGNNGINMTFLRALLPLPILVLLALKEGGVKASKKQMRTCAILGFLSYGCTAQLCMSYSYISVGVATSLHFLYPLYVSLYELIIQKVKKNALYFVGLALALIGAAFFLDTTGQGLNLLGVFLAVISGMFYAGYMIVLSHEAGGEPLPLFRLTLGISIAGLILFGIFGTAVGQINFQMTGKAWIYAAASAILATVGASVLFQAGVRSVGKANAAIFSLLEPICSIIFSVLLMGDTMTITKLSGCAFIIVGLFLTTVSERGKETVF